MISSPVDQRLKDVIHYIISHSSPEKLGATKLNKVMWKADVAYYRMCGETITGQESYIRMPQGPVPNRAREALDQLKLEEKVFERPVETQVGVRREFLWRERASARGFTSEQVEILQEAIRSVCELSAARASDETHDALWDEIENGSQIPIRAASVTPTYLEPSDLDWALSYAGRLD